MKTFLTDSPKNSLIWLYPNGTIIYSTTMSLKFHCHMNLWRFPMDSQICEMELGSYGYPSDDLQLVWWYNISDIEKNVQVEHVFTTDFQNPSTDIIKVNSKKKLNGLFSLLIIKFNFQRNFFYHLVYTFLPSILIVCVSWVSFYIDHKAAPARVPFCLLTLLSIMTQWSNINASLPRLSYLKAIDIWMFICLIFIIASLFEYAIVNSMAVTLERNKLAVRGKDGLKTEMNLPAQTSSKLYERYSNPPTITVHFKGCDDLKIKKKNKDSCLKPEDVDKIASIAFPMVFICVKIIFWSVLWLVK